MLSDDQVTEHDQLYTQAAALMKDEMLLNGVSKRRVGFMVKRKLNHAIRLLTRVVEINEANWNAMWVLGKAYQRLGDQSAALTWFDRALHVDSSNPNVGREATACALELGRGPEAVAYAQAAIEADSADAGLTANLALAYLIAGDSDRAQETAKEAVLRNPSDAISRNVLRIVGEVRTGVRRQPKCMNDLTR